MTVQKHIKKQMDSKAFQNKVNFPRFQLQFKIIRRLKKITQTRDPFQTRVRPQTGLTHPQSPR